MAEWFSAIGTVLAVFAAVAAPYITARIERRRRYRSAMRLGEMVAEILEVLAVLHGAIRARPGLDVEHAGRTLKIEDLVHRINTMPVEHIEDADALESFIRLGGLARSAAAVSIVTTQHQQTASIDEMTLAMSTLRNLSDDAWVEVAIMRRRLRQPTPEHLLAPSKTVPTPAEGEAARLHRH